MLDSLLPADQGETSYTQPLLRIEVTPAQVKSILTNKGKRTIDGRNETISTLTLISLEQGTLAHSETQGQLFVLFGPPQVVGDERSQTLGTEVEPA